MKLVYILLALISLTLSLQTSATNQFIPEGKITKYRWESKIFPNTIRDYYVYVPAQYKKSQPAAIMVFQDGHHYADKNSPFKVPVVFDTLIYQNKLPVIIGIFIDPGREPEEINKSSWDNSNRRREYDTLSDAYARMLIEEIIPEVGKKYNLTSKREERAIAGMSSGGICAFTAAWQRSDYFHKVLSHIGSFVNIEGGHQYPTLIRKGPLRDIRIFLQDGKQDLDNEHGNWWLSNLQMEAALKFRNYDYKFVATEGGHVSEDGGHIMEETLLWLWR